MEYSAETTGWMLTVGACRYGFNFIYKTYTFNNTKACLYKQALKVYQCIKALLAGSSYSDPWLIRTCECPFKCPVLDNPMKLPNLVEDNVHCGLLKYVFNSI